MPVGKLVCRVYLDQFEQSKQPGARVVVRRLQRHAQVRELGRDARRLPPPVDRSAAPPERRVGDAPILSAPAAAVLPFKQRNEVGGEFVLVLDSVDEDQVAVVVGDEEIPGGPVEPVVDAFDPLKIRRQRELRHAVDVLIEVR
jgi:hypothetical protein